MKWKVSVAGGAFVSVIVAMLAVLSEDGRSS